MGRVLVISPKTWTKSADHGQLAKIGGQEGRQSLLPFD